VVRNWQEYYHLRGIPAASPVAVLLSYPLSVYHAMRLLEAKGAFERCIAFPCNFRLSCPARKTLLATESKVLSI
jgi:hypothetical protein